MTKVSLVQYLLQVSLLSHAQAETVAQHTRAQDFKKGEFFLRPPTVCNEIVFVSSGLFRYYVIGDDGEEITSMFMRPGDFFTDLESYHQRKPAEGYAEAIIDSETCILSRDVHEKLKKIVEGWYDTITTISERKLLEQLKLSRDLMPLDAQGAYETFRDRFPTIAEQAPDTQIASFLGISKFTLSRIKAKLSK